MGLWEMLSRNYKKKSQCKPSNPYNKNLFLKGVAQINFINHVRDLTK